MTSPANTSPPSPRPAGLGDTLPGLLKVHRGQLVAVAVIGVVIGLIGLVFPGATLLTIAILFGSYLIASGIFRITAAFIAGGVAGGLRWFNGVLGVIVVIAGILCLANPFSAIFALAFVIGIGWIAEGVIDLMAALRGSVTPRWLGILSGVVSIAAGVAMFVLPAAGIASLVFIGSILLIAVSVTTLLTLPRRPKAARA